MDGKKIHRISDMMSRGAYVLVPIGQAFRETWYFLPDNAIDTRSVLLRLNKKIQLIIIKKRIPSIINGNRAICTSS